MTTLFALNLELQAKICNYFEEEALLEGRIICKALKSLIESKVGLDCTLEGYIQPNGCTICQGNEADNLYPKLNFFMENSASIRRLTINRWYPEKDQHSIEIIYKLIREPDKLEWVTLRRLEMDFLYETINCTKQNLVHLTHISVTEITTGYEMKRRITEQKYKNPICMENLQTFNLRLEFTTDEHDFLESFYLLLLVKAPNLKELGIIAEYRRRHDNLQLDMTCNLLGVVAHFISGCENLKNLWIWKSPTARYVYRCSKCDKNNQALQDYTETRDRVEEDDLQSSTKVGTDSLEEVIKFANNPQLNEMMSIKDVAKKVEFVKEMLTQVPVTSLKTLNVRMGTPRESIMYTGLVTKQKELKDLKVQLDYINVGSDENPPWKQIITNIVEPVKETIESLGITARFKKTIDLAAVFKGYKKLKSLHLWQYGGGRSVSRGDRQHHYSHFQYHVRWLAPKKFNSFADQDLGLQEFPFIDAHECFMIERIENIEEEEEEDEVGDEEEEEDVELEDVGVANDEEDQEIAPVAENLEADPNEEEDQEMEPVAENLEADPNEEDDMEMEEDEEEELEDEQEDDDEANAVEDDDDHEVEVGLPEEVRPQDAEEEEEDEEEDDQDDFRYREVAGIRPIYSSDEEDSDNDIDADFCLSANSPEPDVVINLREVSNSVMEIQMFPNLQNLQIADAFPVLENLSLTYMNILPSEFSKPSLEQFENLKCIDIDMGRDVIVFHDCFGIELVDLLEFTKLRKLNKLRILPIKSPGRGQEEGDHQYFRRILDDTGKQLVRDGVLEMPAGYY